MATHSIEIGGGTEEMISDSCKFHFVLEVVMSGDFVAGGQSSIDNLAIFYSLWACFSFRGTVGECINKFLCITTSDGRDNVDIWE